MTAPPGRIGCTTLTVGGSCDIHPLHVCSLGISILWWFFNIAWTTLKSLQRLALLAQIHQEILLMDPSGLHTTCPELFEYFGGSIEVSGESEILHWKHYIRTHALPYSIKWCSPWEKNRAVSQMFSISPPNQRCCVHHPLRCQVHLNSFSSTFLGRISLFLYLIYSHAEVHCYSADEWKNR